MSVLFKEGYATAITMVKALATAIVTQADNEALSLTWKLEYPASVADIEEYAVISRSLGNNSEGASIGSVYIEFNQPDE